MAYRENTYTEASYYRLQPVARLDVVPGQSVTGKVAVKFESVAFLQNILSGGVAHLYAFYTPYRLLWEDWIEFASDPDTTLQVPSVPVQWASMFEKNANVNCFGRRAYKLIYNQYFGSQQWNQGTITTWYDDITDDSDVSFKYLRTTDQFAGKLLPTDAAPDKAYTAPVTGTSPNQVATIQLNDFRRQMVRARSDRRAQMTGDKYVDAMQRMGVRLDWRVQMAPEFLGQTICEFDSQKTRSSFGDDPAANTVLGRAFARYAGTMELNLGRHFFAEHGLIWFVAAVRPYALAKTTPAPFQALSKSRSSFYFGDNQAGQGQCNAADLGVGGNPAYYPSFQYLKSGQNLIGAASPVPWVPEQNPPSIGRYVWPVVTTVDDDQLTLPLAFWTRCVFGGPTPVKTNAM